MDNTFIPKGMEIIKAAVVADNNDELENALSLYRQGLGYFMTGLKYVKNDTAKVAIREKMNTYMTRAEQIKDGQ
jgi:vacuolar protein-sorting-associated protein 4